MNIVYKIRRGLAQVFFPELVHIEIDRRITKDQLTESRKAFVEARQAFRDADVIFAQSRDVKERRAARDKLRSALHLDRAIIYAEEITHITVAASKITCEKLTPLKI